MRKIFEAELQGIGEDLLAMAQAVEQAMTQAGAALLTADNKLAESVISHDRRIDEMQHALDERIVHVLAQQAPVARDLRTLVAALRMSATLERMGDLAKHVAEAARRAYPGKALRPSIEPTFAKMVDAAVASGRAVTKLVRTRDLELAEAIRRDDTILDDLLVATFDEVLSPNWDGDAREVVELTLLGRFLERFGDHAASIARRIVFLVTGDMTAGAQTPPVTPHYDQALVG